MSEDFEQSLRNPADCLDVFSCSACIPVFHPEYGRYMLESTPGEPYGATLDDLLLVEGNMRFRFVDSLKSIARDVG